MSNKPNDQQSGFSRRDALKRGAAVGGAMWVAPLVTATPAFGADPSDETGDTDLCPNPLWVKYGDPEPTITWTPNEVVEPGEWDDTYAPADDGDVPCLGDYTGASTGWADFTATPIDPVYTGTSYTETWSAAVDGGETYTFTAVVTETSITITVVDSSSQGVPIGYALWYQAGECYPVGASPDSGSSMTISGSTLTWLGPTGANAPDKISHISFVICA